MLACLVYKDSAVVWVLSFRQQVDPQQCDPAVLPVAGALGFPVVSGLDHTNEIVEGLDFDEHHPSPTGRRHYRGEYLGRRCRRVLSLNHLE